MSQKTALVYKGSIKNTPKQPILSPKFKEKTGSDQKIKVSFEKC